MRTRNLWWTLIGISEDEFRSKYGLYTENKSIQSVTAVEANYNNHEYYLL